MVNIILTFTPPLIRPTGHNCEVLIYQSVLLCPNNILLAG